MSVFIDDQVIIDLRRLDRRSFGRLSLRKQKSVYFAVGGKLSYTVVMLVREGLLVGEGSSLP